MTRPANTPGSPLPDRGQCPRRLDFYSRAFGFAAGDVVDENGVPIHAEMRYRTNWC